MQTAKSNTYLSHLFLKFYLFCFVLRKLSDQEGCCNPETNKVTRNSCDKSTFDEFCKFINFSLYASNLETGCVNLVFEFEYEYDYDVDYVDYDYADFAPNLTCTDNMKRRTGVKMKKLLMSY